MSFIQTQVHFSLLYSSLSTPQKKCEGTIFSRYPKPNQQLCSSLYHTCCHVPTRLVARCLLLLCLWISSSARAQHVGISYRSPRYYREMKVPATTLPLLVLPLSQFRRANRYGCAAVQTVHQLSVSFVAERNSTHCIMMLAMSTWLSPLDGISARRAVYQI